MAKQGLKFKLNTKVLGATREGDRVSVKVDAAKGGKEETVATSHERNLGTGNQLTRP